MLELTAAGVAESVIGTFIGGIAIATLSWIWRGELRAAWQRQVRPRMRGGWAHLARAAMTVAIVLVVTALFVGAEWLKLAIEDGLRVECSSGTCQAEDLVAIGKCETMALIEARARTGSLLKTEEQIAFRRYALTGWAACLAVGGYRFTKCKMTEEGCARPRTSW